MQDELISPKNDFIGGLFEEKKIFKVPVCQRPYSWQNSEIDVLLADIWQEYTTLDKPYLYIGNIVLHEDNEFFHIVDGQQRITTFVLLLLAFYAHLHELGIQEENNNILKSIKKCLFKTEAGTSKWSSVIELGSIDKEIIKHIFEKAYSNPKELKAYVYNCSEQNLNPFEKNIKNSFLKSYNFIAKQCSCVENKEQEIVAFGRYILEKVYLIVIKKKGTYKKTFSIFESINGKGKKLEEIDLIKSAIFAELLEGKDYEEHLDKWGKLIIQTKDKLDDYLKIYLRANIKYFTGNITCNRLKHIKEELCSHFKKENLADAYKALINDMLVKIEYFNVLFDDSLDNNRLKKIIINNKLEFYYSLFIKLQYEHPRALFYRCFCDYDNGKGNLSKDDFITIFISTIQFCVSFLTISDKDSKSAISVFKGIFDRIYSQNKIDRNDVLYQISNLLKQKQSTLLEALKIMDVYDKNKILGVAIAATYKTTNLGKDKISWDEAAGYLKTYGSHLSLDHIMPQNPNLNDTNLKYYKSENLLKLKDGADFPAVIYNDMSYEDFTTTILNRAGNLKLKGIDKNASKGNKPEVDFYNYNALKKRNDAVCTFFVENVLKLEPLPKGYMPTVIEDKRVNKLVGNFNFAMRDIKLKKANPKAIIILDKTIEIKHIVDILREIVAYMAREYKNKLIEMAEKEWGPRKRKMLSNTKEVLTRADTIIENVVYLETNLSASDIWEYSGLLLDECGIEREKVSIYIPD